MTSYFKLSMNNDDMKWNKENEKQFRHESFEHRSAAFDIGPMATIKIVAITGLTAFS